VDFLFDVPGEPFIVAVRQLSQILTRARVDADR
jgi:hypothetical protein